MEKNTRETTPSHNRSEPTQGLVWLNGEFLDFASARVPIEDRGFLFGDGIYEVIRVYNRKLFALDEHVARLFKSAPAIELELPLSAPEFKRIVQQLVDRSGLAEAEIYIQVTRGVAPRSLLFPSNVSPTVVMMVWPHHRVPPERREQGVAVKTFPDERWGRCDIKSICLLPNLLARERAHRAGAWEAVLVRDELVTEGAASSVFMVSQGEVTTPIADHRVLAGVTRSFVLDVARASGYTTVERDIPLDELVTAPEVFITSTTIEILPVVRIDDITIGIGRPGPVFRDLLAAYRARLPG